MREGSFQWNEASRGQEEYGKVVYGWVSPFPCNPPKGRPDRYPAATFRSFRVLGAVVLQFPPSQRHLELHSRVLFVGLWWDSRICVSGKFPGETTFDHRCPRA